MAENDRNDATGTIIEVWVSRDTLESTILNNLPTPPEIPDGARNNEKPIPAPLPPAGGKG